MRRLIKWLRRLLRIDRYIRLSDYLRGLCLALMVSTVHGAALEEVNYWRRHNQHGRLAAFIEDKALTRFAQHKAEYRAARGLKDGHQGPKPSDDCREGTAEALPLFGWISCVMEETGRLAGAGVAIGDDGERYMVLVVRGKGYAPFGSQNLVCIPTAHMTPNAPRIHRINRTIKIGRW